MRFNFNDSNNFQTHLPLIEGWQEAPAPSEKRIQGYGLVASCLGMFLVNFLLQGEFVPSGFLPTMLILVFTMPVHEFIHALSTPTWGLSIKTVIGIQKRKGLIMPYVYYDGEQPLWRFLLTGVAPTIFLTMLPIIVVTFAPLAKDYRAGLGFLSFYNVAISGGDLFLFIWTTTHLRLSSYVRQNGWKLYWKAAI